MAERQIGEQVLAADDGGRRGEGIPDISQGRVLHGHPGKLHVQSAHVGLSAPVQFNTRTGQFLALLGEFVAL